MEVEYIAVRKEEGTWYVQTNLTTRAIGRNYIFPTDALLDYAESIDVVVHISDIYADADSAIWAGNVKVEENRFGCLFGLLTIVAFWVFIFWLIL